MNKVDLHTHTLASDGLQAPSENVKIARDKGLYGLAITDHDTVGGVEEALEAGKRWGIVVVPGVEISTQVGEKDIHILGYGIDPGDPVLLSRLQQLRRHRRERNEKMVEKLNEAGIPVTLEEVEKQAGKKSEEDSVGRPHIAAWLVRHGVVKSVGEAFDQYLKKGAKAYVPREGLAPREAVAWIREAGGKAVIAHPGLYHDNERVRALIAEGVDGIEAYHSDHSPEEEDIYRRMAETHGLLVTGGSDFHGTRDGRTFHGEIGSRTVSADILRHFRRHP